MSITGYATASERQRLRSLSPVHETAERRRRSTAVVVERVAFVATTGIATGYATEVEGERARAHSLSRETALRRRLRAELTTIHLAIVAGRGSLPHQDALTLSLQQWHHRFTLALESQADMARIEQQAIPLLQRLLVDPLTQAPLDAAALLGSDGRTYNSHALSVYYSNSPERYRSRSPLAPEDPTPFTVRPHPVVQYLMRYPSRYRTATFSVEVERVYEQMRAEGRLLPLPMLPHYRAAFHRNEIAQQALALVVSRRGRERNRQEDRENVAALSVREQPQEVRLPEPTDLAALAARMQRARARRLAQEERQQQQSAALRQFFNTAQVRAQQEVAATFAPIARAVEESASSHTERLTVLETREREEIALLRNHIATLRQRTAELAVQEQELREKIDKLDTTIECVRRDNLQLSIAINETERAIQERNENALTGLLSVAMVIGATTACTWAIAQVVGALQLKASAAILPQKGGALLRINIPI